MKDKIIDFKFEEVKSLKEKAKDKFYNGVNFLRDHKETVLVLAPVVISGAVEIVKIIAKRGNLKQEQKLKDNYIYDSKGRHYYELNKRPSNSEWIQIDERVNSGELLGRTLREMGFID